MMNNGLRNIAFLLLLLTITSCTSFVRFTSEEKIKMEVENDKTIALVSDKLGLNEEDFSGEVMIGIASYYAEKFHGKKTASGEIYDQDDFTAAHRTLPFGTKILVTNLENNKSVIVRINDRGPYKKNRLIDVSRAAAEELDMIQSGIVEVELKVLK